MENFSCRFLRIDECDFIKSIDASHYIDRAWRMVDGERKLVDIDYFDPDWPNGYQEHLNNLKDTVENGGTAIGAFDREDRLVGFVTINREMIGEKYRYALLDQLFITRELRGKGIGKKLFLMAAMVAKEWGAERLYICAGSAEDTIGFYNSLGCRDSEEIIKELYEEDPRDLQLEYVL